MPTRSERRSGSLVRTHAASSTEWRSTPAIVRRSALSSACLAYNNRQTGGIQQELYRHYGAVSCQAITVASFQMCRASLACRITHLAPQTRSPGVQLFFGGAADGIGEPA